MAIKTSFLDDAEYGAADINAITARLVAQGIEAGATQFRNGAAYNLTQLNDLTKAYATPGVAYVTDTALRVIKSGSAYYVQPGTCFFGNGSVTVIDEAEIVTPISGAASYVYMISDISANSNRIAVSAAEPDYKNNSNIVPLALIDSSGNITDMRFYARGKLPGYQVPAVTAKSITFTSSDFSAGYKDVDLGVTALSLIAAVSGGVAVGILTFDAGKKGEMYRYPENTSYAFKVDHVNHEPYLVIGYNKIASAIEYRSGTTWRFTLHANYSTNGYGDTTTKLIYV